MYKYMPFDDRSMVPKSADPRRSIVLGFQLRDLEDVVVSHRVGHKNIAEAKCRMAAEIHSKWT
jgi:hypothetical protein